MQTYSTPQESYSNRQNINKFISASLLFNRFMKHVRVGLHQLNMIYEGQLTSASILRTKNMNDFDALVTATLC